MTWRDVSAERGRTYHCATFEDQAFFAGDLRYGTCGREVAAEDLDVAGRLDWIVEWADEDLILRK